MKNNSLEVYLNSYIIKVLLLISGRKMDCFINTVCRTCLSQKNANLEALRVRWINLPVNK